jgi:hypothetical protein
VEVVVFEVTLRVVLAETEMGEAELVDVNEVMLLVPLPLGAVIELFDEALLVVETNEDVVVSVVEVELSPLEVPVLNEVVLLEEVDDKLDVVEVIVGSVAVEPVTDTDEDEDEDDPVRELDKVGLVDDEVVTIEELLTVEDGLVGIALPSTQLQRVVSSGAVYFWNGDEGLDLVWMLVWIARFLSQDRLFVVEVTEVVWFSKLACKRLSALLSRSSRVERGRRSISGSSSTAICSFGTDTIADSGDIGT